jgi:hypothetical protein
MIFDKNITLEHQSSDTGDICHRNIKQLSSGQARKYAIDFCKPEYLRICLKNSEVSFDSNLLSIN